MRHCATQANESNGFWSAFHELVGGYPWLTKRVARVVKPDVRMPPRNVVAYLLAASCRMAAGSAVRPAR